MLVLTAITFLFLLLSFETSCGQVTNGTVTATTQQLLAAVQSATGVYLKPQAGIIHNALANTVLVSAGNFPYIHFFDNFVCYVKRLQLKMLFLALDEKIYSHAQSLNNPNIISYHWKSAGVSLTEKAAVFNTPQFHTITTKKEEGVLEILKLGYDVIFIDLDVALLRDPIPYMVWNNVDYVHSLNQICPHCTNWDFFETHEEGNTGVYFVRSNERTIKLFDDLSRLAPKFPTIDDQTIFWQHVRTTKDQKISPQKTCKDVLLSEAELALPASQRALVTCHLDGCIFSAGALRGVAWDWLKDNLENRLKTKAVTVHANYLKGLELKESALKRHRLWIFEQGKCREFTPPV